MSVYFQPMGFLYGQESAMAQKAEMALSLAGQKTSFSMVKVMERGQNQKTCNLYTVSELLNSTDPFIQEKLQRLTKSRQEMKGLSFVEPLIMGVLNVTPDSFSDGGQFDSVEHAIAQGQKMLAQGADIIDIGGESTRPGADNVGARVELERVLPVLKGLSSQGLCSIDSRGGVVMKAALNAGAQIVNDVTALTYDKTSMSVVSDSTAPVILMHSRMTPKDEAQDMAQNPDYQNVCLDIYDYLEARIAACMQAGIEKERLIIDPGIGFGKTFKDNIDLLGNISLFHGLGVPILVGLSRKRFIGVIAEQNDPIKRDPGSISLSLDMIRQGVQIVRVHNVGDMKQALRCFLTVLG